MVTDQGITKIVDRLNAQAPFSPGFYAVRDELELFAAPISARAAKSLGAISLGMLSDSAIVQAWRRIDGWVKILESRVVDHSDRRVRIRAKRSWFSLRVQPVPREGDDLVYEITASISDLTAIRDQVLHQVITINRMLQEFKYVIYAFGLACTDLTALQQAIAARSNGPIEPALADAIVSEIFPVMAQREQAMFLEMSLVSRAQLELGAIGHHNDVLIGLIEDTIKAVQFVSTLAEAIGLTNQELDAAHDDLRAMRDAQALVGRPSPGHSNAIEPGRGTDAQAAMAGLDRQLTRVGAVLAQLDSNRHRLEAIASQALSCSTS